MANCSTTLFLQEDERRKPWLPSPDIKSFDDIFNTVTRRSEAQERASGGTTNTVVPVLAFLSSIILLLIWLSLVFFSSKNWFFYIMDLYMNAVCPRSMNYFDVLSILTKLDKTSWTHGVMKYLVNIECIVVIIGHA